MALGWMIQHIYHLFSLSLNLLSILRHIRCFHCLLFHLSRSKLLSLLTRSVSTESFNIDPCAVSRGKARITWSWFAVCWFGFQFVQEAVLLVQCRYIACQTSIFRFVARQIWAESSVNVPFQGESFLNCNFNCLPQMIVCVNKWTKTPEQNRIRSYWTLGWNGVAS